MAEAQLKKTVDAQLKHSKTRILQLSLSPLQSLYSIVDPIPKNNLSTVKVQLKHMAEAQLKTTNANTHITSAARKWRAIAAHV
jgi:hypothetical protein